MLPSRRKYFLQWSYNSFWSVANASVVNSLRQLESCCKNYFAMPFYDGLTGARCNKTRTYNANFDSFHDGGRHKYVVIYGSSIIAINKYIFTASIVHRK